MKTLKILLLSLAAASSAVDANVLPAGKDGKMTFDIKRGGATRPVTIQLEAIGSYGATYPIDCPKSQRIVDETAAFILRNGGPGEGINGNLEALFLLSTGNPDCLPALRRYAAGAQAFTTLVLARECGVEVNEKSYDDALRLFFRYAGRGGVPYGDHHPELWWSSNGKNGGTAAALALLPDAKFQGGAKLLALAETDTYWGCEGGHGSSFGNQTFRNIVDALVRESHPESWRRNKDEMNWYYELARMPGGGFRTPWFPGHGTIGKEPMHQTGLLAMAYTAHLGNLRICGKPRTEFSVPHRPTAVEMSLPANDFQRTDFIEGATIDEKPHEIANVFQTFHDESGKVIASGADASRNDKRKKRMPAAWYAKLMRHYSPTVRDWAARSSKA